MSTVKGETGFTELDKLNLRVKLTVKGDEVSGGAIKAYFTSETERDTFFSANLQLLKIGLPIAVSIDSTTVSVQQWTGDDEPPVYTPVSWITASLQTPSGSIDFIGLQRIGGAGIGFIGLENIPRNEFYHIPAIQWDDDGSLTLQVPILDALQATFPDVGTDLSDLSEILEFQLNTTGLFPRPFVIKTSSLTFDVAPARIRNRIWEGTDTDLDPITDIIFDVPGVGKHPFGPAGADRQFFRVNTVYTVRNEGFDENDQRQAFRLVGTDVGPFLIPAAETIGNFATLTNVATEPFVDENFLKRGPNVFFASTIDDLPEISGGVYTIAEGEFLFLEAIIDIGSDQIELIESAMMSGFGETVSGITSSNASSTLFITAGVTAAPTNINNVSIVNTSVSPVSVTFDSSLVGPQLSKIRVEGNIVAGDFAAFNIEDSLFIDNGIDFASSSSGIFSSQNCGFAQTGTGTAIDVQTGVTIGAFEIVKPQFNLNAGSTGISLTGTADVLKGSIDGGRFEGAGTFTSGFDEVSDEWEFTNVEGFPDSTDQGVIQAEDFNGVTVPLTLDVWTDINDAGNTLVYSLLPGNEKFKNVDPINGEVEYTGVRDRSLKIGGSVNLRKDIGGTTAVEIGVSINGATPLVSSKMSGVTTNNNAVTITIPAVPLPFNEGDKAKLQMRNIADSSDVEVFEVKTVAFF